MNTQTLISASQELLLIPMSQLRPSARNVRKTPSTSIPELASSIARVGLLQNLRWRRPATANPSRGAQGGAGWRL